MLDRKQKWKGVGEKWGRTKEGVVKEKYDGGGRDDREKGNKINRKGGR